MQSLDFIIINYRITIDVNHSTLLPSSFAVNIYTPNTSDIRVIAFRYLVLHSDFTKIHVSYISQTPGSNCNSSTSCSIYQSGLPNIQGSVSAFVVFTGFDIESPDPSKNFWYNKNSITSTTIALSIVTIYNLTIYSMSFLVLRYDSSSISNSPKAIRITPITKSFVSPATYSSSSKSPINTIFGISSPVVGANDNYLNFNFYALNDTIHFSTTNLIAGSGLDDISIMVI